jgi:arylsulfatase A
MSLIHDVSDDFEPPPPFGPDGRYESVKEMSVEMDRIVGKMVQVLDDLGLADNTLVIFTTDNGTNHTSILGHKDGEFFEETVYSMIDGVEVPGGKTKITDWGIRVPTFIRWPGRIQEGSVCHELIDFSDFLPTFNDLLDLPPAAYEIDGQSFAGVLTGQGHDPREWVYTEKAGMDYMVRSKDWKLLPGGKLFDMRSDIHEENPILESADTPASAKARVTLDSIMTELRSSR